MKKVSILIIALMVMGIGLLSGCDENYGRPPRYDDKLEVIDYQIRTIRYIGWNERDILEPYSENFIYNSSMEAYEIEAYAKNNADKVLPKVVFRAMIFDENNVHLTSLDQEFYDFGIGNTERFVFVFTEQSLFERAEYVEFNFDVYFDY